MPAKIPRVIEIAKSKIRNDKSKETLPIRRLGTNFRIALSGGSVNVKTNSLSKSTGPRGRQSREKMATYSKTKRVMSTST
jgi:hypothetical protein